MYRVRDTEKDCWITDDVYLSPFPDNDLYLIKKNFFGHAKLEVAPSSYVYQRYVELIDKYLTPVYEGDIIRAQVGDDKSVVGMVVYAEEVSGYIILCNETGEWFSLGSEVSDLIEVIGNVFDNKDLLNFEIDESEEE